MSGNDLIGNSVEFVSVALTSSLPTVTLTGDGPSSNGRLDRNLTTVVYSGGKHSVTEQIKLSLVGATDEPQQI